MQPEASPSLGVTTLIGKSASMDKTVGKSPDCASSGAARAGVLRLVEWHDGKMLIYLVVV